MDNLFTNNNMFYFNYLSLLPGQLQDNNLIQKPKVPQHTGLTGGEHQGSRHHLICAPSPLLIETG